MMHISKGLWQGVITASFGELPDSNNSLMLKYKKDAYGKFAAKGERWGVFYYAGIMFSEPFVEAVKRCGRNLTRKRLVAELEGLKNFRGIGGSISYGRFSPDNGYGTRQGMKEVFLVECLEGGKAKKLTDWTTIRYP